MQDFKTIEVTTDLLILGGGMSACGAAVEAAYWAKKHHLKVTLVDKAAIDRSGAVAMGLSAINTYIGLRDKANTVEQFVQYVRNDQMGTVREDLVYDVARHVDSSVHLFEKWGLPIWKDDNGAYVHEGRWQIMINGESYKVVIAEAAKNALGVDNIYERICITHPLVDGDRISGAVGFSVRDNAVYCFKAKAVIVAMGGAVHVFRPRSTGEGFGRAWYPPWNAGSTYAYLLQAGAELTQMESRFIPTRFKDGYGPVGAWFLLFKSAATNAFDVSYVANMDMIKPWAPYADAKPVPTPLRNHQMITELVEGRGPVFMRTEDAIKKQVEGLDEKAAKKKLKHLESEAWEDFLDMTISQALMWAANNIAPEERPSEIMASEPYFIGSHASCAGAWVSGPSDIAPKDYDWGYNRMTTVRGMFAAGDGVGAAPHKFSSGSHAEGRIAAKSAIRYILDNPSPLRYDAAAIDAIKARILLPLKVYEDNKDYTVTPDVHPGYILPKMALFRLNKIMDEYVGGTSQWYATNEKMLARGQELLTFLREDSEKFAAKDLHDLLRVWEVISRLWTAEAHLRHVRFRTETRYPGYLYRTDFKNLDEQNWKVFVNSRWNPATGEWTLRKVPIVSIVK